MHPGIEVPEIRATEFQKLCHCPQNKETTKLEKKGLASAEVPLFSEP